MKRKVIISLITVATLLACIAFLASPYIFVASPKFPVLVVYFEKSSFLDAFANGFYILDDGSMEVIVGQEKWIKIDDPDWSNTIRRATEDEGHWKKIVDRKKIKLSDEQYQKLIGLADELEEIPFKVVPGERYSYVPEIYVKYKGQDYGMRIDDGADLDVNDHSVISFAGAYALIRDIATIVMEASPIPMEPLLQPIPFSVETAE